MIGWSGHRVIGRSEISRSEIAR